MTQDDQRPEGQQRKRRGGDVKKAPPGFYTAGRAQRRLGLDKSTFQYYVSTGKIKKKVPPLRSEGYYPIEEIDRLADEMTLFMLQNTSEDKYEPTEFRVATPEDAPGIFNVVAKLWGEKVATPVDVRKAWYRVNPLIDHVVTQNGLIMGYINMVPYIPPTLEAMMSGQKRGWDIRPHDILPFEPGREYDVFTGVAVRPDVPYRERYGRRLLSGLMRFLENLARQDITIRRMYATSDQPDGIELCEALGFMRDQTHQGDLFGRFVLDIATADSPFARRYREVFQHRGKRRPPTTLSFRKATLDDVEKENDLAYLVFGERALNPETRAARRKFLATNPDITYHAYDRDTLIASINLVPLAHEAIEEFIRKGKRGWLFDTSDIRQFRPGEPLECIIIDMMTTPILPPGKIVYPDKRAHYAMYLLSGLRRVLEDWGRQGIEIARVYSSGGTDQGQRLLESAGFHVIADHGARVIYELDIAKSGQERKGELSDYLMGYRKALAEWKLQHAGEVTNQGKRN